MEPIAPLNISEKLPPADVVLQLTTTAGLLEAQKKVVTNERVEYSEALAAFNEAAPDDPKYQTKNLAVADEHLDTIKASINELRTYCRDNCLDFNKLVTFNNLKNDLRKYYYAPE